MTYSASLKSIRQKRPFFVNGDKDFVLNHPSNISVKGYELCFLKQLMVTLNNPSTSIQPTENPVLYLPGCIILANFFLTLMNLCLLIWSINLN